MMICSRPSRCSEFRILAYFPSALCLISDDPKKCVEHLPPQTPTQIPIPTFFFMDLVKCGMYLRELEQRWPGQARRRFISLCLCILGRARMDLSFFSPIR